MVRSKREMFGDKSEPITSHASNYHFGVLASPHKHEELITEVNGWKYPVEGRIFKGEQSPFISELRYYDIRIPDAIEEDVLRDLRINSIDKIAGVSKSWRFRLLSWLQRTVLFFTPFKPMPKYELKPPKYKPQGGWHYAMGIGKIKRKPVAVKTGGRRGVL